MAIPLKLNTLIHSHYSIELPIIPGINSSSQLLSTPEWLCLIITLMH